MIGREPFSSCGTTTPTGEPPAEDEPNSNRHGPPEPWRFAEDRARLASDNAPIDIAIVGLDHRLQKVNRALCDALGCIEREVPAHTFVTITHPDEVGRDVAKEMC